MSDKNEKLNKLIMTVIERATTHQTGYHIYQKIKRITSSDGNAICIRMRKLCDEEGKIKRVGHDEDGDSQYTKL